jgi:hypothetical protein
VTEALERKPTSKKRAPSKRATTAKKAPSTAKKQSDAELVPLERIAGIDAPNDEPGAQFLAAMKRVFEEDPDALARAIVDASSKGKNVSGLAVWYERCFPTATETVKIPRGERAIRALSRGDRRRLMLYLEQEKGIDIRVDPAGFESAAR